MNKSITIKNPTKNNRVNENLSVEEMANSALFDIAGFMKREIEHPDKRSVWPRKWEIVSSNGKNGAVIAKVAIQKFDDVKNSGQEMGEFIEHYVDLTGFIAVDEDGTEHKSDLATEPILFMDFGARYADENEDGSSQAQIS